MRLLTSAATAGQQQAVEITIETHVLAHDVARISGAPGASGEVAVGGIIRGLNALYLRCELSAGFHS